MTKRRRGRQEKHHKNTHTPLKNDDDERETEITPKKEENPNYPLHHNRLSFLSRKTFTLSLTLSLLTRLFSLSLSTLILTERCVISD